MANYLILNQNQIWNGLGTLTYTVESDGQYNVRVNVTFPQSIAINSNVNQNVPGIGGGLVTGQLALGGGSGAGLGAGTGGGGEGFTKGDQGAGEGGVGQGFGATNNYQQPPSAGSNVVANSNLQSELSIVVNVNGSPVYTSSAPKGNQSNLNFATDFSASDGDSVTVVLSSSASIDNQLDGIKSNISISEGLL